MANMRQQFEKELKNKLSLKSSGHTAEETVLLKAFKYFDLDNSGHCSKSEFLKAISKIGITGFSDSNLLDIFALYDSDKSGELNYKEFISGVFNSTAIGKEKASPEPSAQQAEASTKQEYLNTNEVDSILQKIRMKLAARGVRGITSIGRSFRIIDDDSSQTLSLSEFKKASKDFRFDLNDEEVLKAFKAFDSKNSGAIDYDEFLRTLRGNMNSFRRGLCEQAFKILDKDGCGLITLDDIKEVYNARNHPDVKSGKRTEDEVLMEFLDTFEEAYNYLNGTEGDGKLTLDEFIEYYENVSMSIDDDAYFELMMNNAWRMNSNTTFNNEKKGWGNVKEEPQPKLAEQFRQKFPQKEEEAKAQTKLGSNSVIDKLRSVLKSRGGKGLIGLAKQFKIFDDNNNKILEFDEFAKAMKDFKVELNQNEVKVLFGMFDRDGSGTIDYDEFLRQVRGEMNEVRRKVVLQAFDRLDLDKSGIVELNEVKSLYNAKTNPDVKSGKKTEEDVYGEFLETFEMHHNITKGTKDKRVTREEFLEYYNNISMSVDDDDYFIAIIQSAWKLNQAPDYTKNKPVMQDFTTPPARKEGRLLGDKHNKIGTHKNAPFGTDNEPVNYSTSNNPKALRSGKHLPKKGDDILLKFREKIASRGTRGIMSIRRNFMIADDNNSKTIDFNEFAKFCYDFRMELTEAEVKKLFGIFDRDNSGVIDYEEFIYGIVGEMNDRRMAIVKKAFAKADKNGNGVLEVGDLKGVYSAKSHPDVLSGKKCEDEVLAEFLDTFEYHFSLLNDKKTKDRTVTLEEFIEYYNNISMSVDDDLYFEVMMTNAWNLENKPNYGKGWKGEY